MLGWSRFANNILVSSIKRCKQVHEPFRLMIYLELLLTSTKLNSYLHTTSSENKMQIGWLNLLWTILPLKITWPLPENWNRKDYRTLNSAGSHRRSLSCYTTTLVTHQVLRWPTLSKCTTPLLQDTTTLAKGSSYGQDECKKLHFSLTYKNSTARRKDKLNITSPGLQSFEFFGNRGWVECPSLLPPSVSRRRREKPWS